MASISHVSAQTSVEQQQQQIIQEQQLFLSVTESFLQMKAEGMFYEELLEELSAMVEI